MGSYFVFFYIYRHRCIVSKGYEKKIAVKVFLSLWVPSFGIRANSLSFEEGPSLASKHIFVSDPDHFVVSETPILVLIWTTICGIKTSLSKKKELVI